MFTRENTKAVKGAAVILMLFHHLAGFPDRFPVGFGQFSSFVSDNGQLTALAANGKLCVSIFFFLGGYGLYKRFESGRSDLRGSIVSLYKQYWKVFAIFVPIAFLFFSRTGDDINIRAARYVITSKAGFVKELILNFIGYSSSFNDEWWFFSSYLFALIAGSLLLKAMGKRRSIIADIIVLFVISVLLCNVLPDINKYLFSNRLLLPSDLSCAFFEGIVFAKYDALAALKKKAGAVPFIGILSIAGIAVIFISRTYFQADMLYAPLFILFASILLDISAAVNKAFVFLGDHSTNIWYVHSFYCYYFLECTKLVYITQNAVIDLLILIAMSLITSVILELIYKRLGQFLMRDS